MDVGQDPRHIPAPDNTGTETEKRFGFQAQVAVRYAIEMLGGYPIDNVTCEHIEDVVVARTLGTHHGGDTTLWDFQQVKSREPNEPWTLLRIGDSKALHSLLRTDRVLRQANSEGSVLPYRLTVAIEGKLSAREPSFRDVARSDGKRESSIRARLGSKLKDLDADPDELSDFLSRIYIVELPLRGELERDNREALGGLAEHLTIAEVWQLHQTLSDLVRSAMVERLGPRWQLFVTRPDPAEVILRKRLTRQTLAAIAVRLLPPELLDFLQASQSADYQHPYGLMETSCPTRLSDVRVPQRISIVASSETLPENCLGQDALCMLTAGPGGGKTSLLRAIQARSAAQWLAGIETQPLALTVNAAALTPLRPLGTALASAANESLSRLGLVRTLGEGFFRTAPRPGTRWLVLVDGIDEITDPELRREVLQWILQCTDRQPAVHSFVVAGRPISDAERKLLRTVPEYRLDQFSTDDLRSAVQGWFRQLGIPRPEASADAFIAALSSVGMSKLARTPLMTSLLCQVNSMNPDGVIPDSRNALYSSFVDLLHERMHSRGPSGFRTQSEYLTQRFGPTVSKHVESLMSGLLDLIGQMAAEDESRPVDPLMYIRPARPEYLPDHSVEAWIRLISRSPAGERPPAITRKIWTDFIVSALTRCGLLVREGDRLEFAHKTMQEYCAARWAMRTPQAYEQELDRTLHRWIHNGGSNPWGAPLETVSYISFLIEADQSPLHDIAHRKLYDNVTRESLHCCLLVAMINRFGSLEPESWQPLIEKAIHSTRAVVELEEDPTTRVWAAEILAELDKDSGLTALESLAKEPTLDREFNEDPHTPDFSDRLQAATALMQFDTRRGADALMQLVLDDEDLDQLVRVRAAEILFENSDERAGAALSMLAKESSWYYSRFEAITLYSKIDRHAAAECLNDLIEEWCDLVPEECQDYAYLLVQWGDPRQLHLVEGLRDEDDI
ncbi:dsDNA nuclease domain-containing protein [Nocardia sp. NPDC051832]|uniref:dsDNA nuclease domain-containing protein n=1 Tax=Nocardia sp. NPDC051832 TaxID=3155673 RepID=UPI00343C3746